MKSIFPFMLTIFILTHFLNCSSTPVPCGGKGLVVDKKPLPVEWTALQIIPDGAISCVDEVESAGMPNHRQLEFAKLDPHTTIKAFQAHLTARGWKQTQYNAADDIFYTLEAEKDGKTVEVRVSKKVTEKGWASVTLK